MEYDLEWKENVQAEFIPGGSISGFVPGWGDNYTGIPGKEIEDGVYVGMVRMWADERRIDRKIRVINLGHEGKDTVSGDLEEKMNFYYEGERFHSDEWGPAAASWYSCAVQLPEGVRHTLQSYINLLVRSYCNDDINDVWRNKYREEYETS